MKKEEEDKSCGVLQGHTHESYYPAKEIHDVNKSQKVKGGGSS